MAKKVRTPPPPRRVQAPQRRETRKTPGGAGRSPWLYAASGAAVVGVIAAVVIAVLVLRDDGGSQPRAAPNYNGLPGIRKTKAPWPVEYEFLADRLLSLDLTTLGGHEGLVTHFHAHLDIFVNGKKVVVPRLIGINPGANYLTELHAHDTRGVIHIEAQKERDFTLGQFIAEWGVYLDARCIGAYCNGLKWYVNGKRETGNPAGLVLESHQEIAIVVGKPPAKIPSKYAFRSGE